MRRFAPYLFSLLSFFAGIVVTEAAHRIAVGPSASSDWFELTHTKATITYNTEALFSDMPLPSYDNYSGRAKFVQQPGTNGSFQLGYTAKFSVPSLDLKKVPPKYLEEKKLMIDGVEVTQMPVDRVSIEATLTFVLKDADGFPLATLTSQKLEIWTGKDNVFQALTPESVSKDVAARTKEISIARLELGKCAPCDSVVPAGKGG